MISQRAFADEMCVKTQKRPLLNKVNCYNCFWQKEQVKGRLALGHKGPFMNTGENLFISVHLIMLQGSFPAFGFCIKSPSYVTVG